MQCGDLNIAVVGGATGGALAALHLARAGAQVSLFERVASPRAVGAGIAVAENGMAVLESLGLRASIERTARRVGPARIADGAGRTLLAPDTGGASLWMIRRSELQGVLLDAVASEERIVTHFGHEVVSASPDGRLSLRERELHFDLIVVADGVHSRLRACGDFGARVHGPGIAYVRALVDAEVACEEEAWTSAGLFGSFALARGTYLYASAGSAACRAAVDARDLDAFRRAWAEAYPPSREILAPLRSWDELLLNRVVRVECRRWQDGRLVLLGDAAHAMAPNLGQGANSAAVDAAILRASLEKAPNIEAGLAAYQARRKAAVTKVATTAARLGALAEATHPLARWMRDRVLLPLVARVPTPTAMVLQEAPADLRAIGRGLAITAGSATSSLSSSK